MVIGRFLGWVLLFATGIVFVRDTIAWLDLRILAPLSLGELWSNLDGSGFMSAHAAIERLAPWLWRWGFAPVLALWALPVLAVLGLALLMVCRTRQRRFR
jgi:hypothetical protein